MTLKEQILEYMEVVGRPCSVSELQDELSVNLVELNYNLIILYNENKISNKYLKDKFYQLVKTMDQEYTEGTELDKSNGDWIDEAARTLTPEQFRGAMLFKIGEHLHGIDKKEEICEEVKKVADYSRRWGAYEAVWLKK